MIQPSDLGGDEDRARLVLVRARTIAPCIDTLDPGSEPGKDAIAVLKDVLAGLPEPGERRTRGLSRNGTSITLDAVGSAFSEDNRAALRAICGASTSSGGPAASFPVDRLFERIWPEERYP